MDQSSKKPLDENARLMRKAAEGDFEAFVCLFQRLCLLLMHLFVKWGVNPDSAEDLALKVLENLWKYRKSFHEESSFKKYLLSIARNTLYKEMLKSHKIDGTGLKRRPVSDEGKYKGLSQPEAELSLKELTEAIEASEAQLTDEQLQALEISQDPGIDLHKALREHGWSIEAYKGLIKRSRKRIKKDLASFFKDNETPKKH
jgi:DNA-directed RNA polymerase specialized sigma24 family protein